MKIYKVGGAVRDDLLGITPKEIDWVVTGATPEIMIQKGFKQVGKDFPVFLHPETKEEYALARIERKTHEGHRGFECYSDPSVTLVDDLKRRDLTINAIAENADGEIIDPYEGRADIKHNVLRHVSEAFVEDPLRVLRIARFSARLSNFTVAPETMTLLKSMVAQGMLNELTPERVWKELERALTEPSPSKFFEVLGQCGANDVLWPELNDQFSLLRAFASVSNDSELRFAMLFYGKTAHDVKAFVEKWKISRKYQTIATMVAFGSLYMEKAKSSESTLVAFLEKMDIKRRIHLAPSWLAVVSFISTPEEAEWFKKAINLFMSVDEKSIVASCSDPKKIRPALSVARKDALSKLFK